jgi:putative ABC transport system substrate-binding protein
MKSMTARLLIMVAGLTLVSLSVPLTVDAQPTGKVPRIGVLRQGSPPDPLVEGLRQGLRELGYVEGRNVSIEYRWAEGRDERLPDLAADLVRLRVDVIVASGNGARVAKRATTTIPIVMPVAADPVGAGLVASLARPGGNVTGFAFQSEELFGKWVELLKEALPGMARLAVLSHPPTEAGQLRVIEAAARSVGVRLHTLKVQRPDDLGPAFGEGRKDRAEALIILASPFFFAHRARLVELAAKHRLPAMYFQREFVVGSGGLMSYGPNLSELFRRAATFVDRILKGARPADLPVEQPTRFELLINMKAAKALGLTIPPSLLARADEVIQ